MFFRKKTITETLKRADDLSGIVEVEASSLSEDQYRRYEAKRYRDMLYRNMVIVRRECRKQLMGHIKRNPLYQHLTWRKYLIRHVAGSPECSWEEVQGHPIHMILSDPCDSVLSHIDIDEEFRAMMRYRMESDGPEHDDIVWLTGSTYKGRSTSWQIDKKKFDETESVLEGFNNRSENSMSSTKFLNSINVGLSEKRAVKRKVVKQKADTIEVRRKSFSFFVRQVADYKAGSGRSDFNKNVLNAVKYNEHSKKHEIVLMRSNVPLMVGKKRYLTVDGDVARALLLIADAIESGTFDKELNDHQSRVEAMRKKVITKS